MHKRTFCTKILTAILAAVQLTAGAALPVAAENTPGQSLTEEQTGGEKEYAEIVFDKVVKTHNIDSYNFLTSAYQYTNKDGVIAMECGIDNGEQGAYINLDVSEKFTENEDAQPIKITVEYYDDGSGSFSLSYHGLNDKAIGSGAYSNGDICRLENTKTWRTHEFYIDDMKFNGGFGGGYDFRFAMWTIDMGWSKQSVFIHSIKMEKSFPGVPAKMTIDSDYTGNIFDVEEEKKFYFNIRNDSKEKGVSKVSYYYTDENGNKIADGEFEQEIAPMTVTPHEVVLDLSDRYARYYMYASMESTFEHQEGTYSYEKESEFSVLDKFDSSELKNDKFFICTHIFHSTSVGEYFDALDWAGFGGMRGTVFSWAETETTKGVMTPTEHSLEIANELKKRGLKAITGPNQSNSVYEPDRPFYSAILPHTEATSEGFGHFCKYIEDNLGDNLAGIEIWNEPNTKGGFNTYGSGPDVYTPFLLTAYKTMKADGLKAPVVGLSPAMHRPDWVRQVFELGGYDGLDEVSIHPYDWSGGFRIQKYIDDMNETKSIMKEYGELKPITLTEMGFSSAKESLISCGDERVQAAIVVMQYVVGEGEDICNRLCYYQLMESGDDITDPEHNFGMIRSATYSKKPNAAKPAYLAAVGVNRMLASAEPVNNIKRDDNIWCYNFKRDDGKNVAVVWAYNSDENVCLNLGTDSVDVYDLYTNKVTTLSDADGKYNIKLKQEPIYLVGNFSSFEEAPTVFSTSTSEVEAVPGDEFSIEYKSSDGGNYDLEFELPENVTVKENNGMTNGSGKVTFELSKKAMGRQIIRVYAKQNGVTKFMDTLACTITDPISVEVNSSQVSENDTEHWQADVTITNTSFKNVLAGTVTLTGPEETVPYAKDVEFNGLAPLSSVTLHLNLEPMKKKRIKTISIHIKLDNGYETDISKELNFTMATYTDKKPKIDGNIDLGEWNGAWMTADQKENVKNNDNWTKENLSLSCNMMWDEKNLYFAAIITDDVHYNNEQASRMWAGDSVQIAFNDQVDSGDFQFIGSVVEDASEFGIALLADGAKIYRFMSLYDKPYGVLENCEVAVKRHESEGKTIYEAIIPWSEVYYDDYDPQTAAMRFSMIANDSDGGARSYIEYNSGIGAGKNAMLFGKMRLAK